MPRKMSIFPSLILLILAMALPALGNECEIKAGHGWITGHANGVPLAKVLAQVSEKAGFPIYIDENLKDTPVTFTIKEKLAPEKAIPRMVRPHSYAVLFGKKTGQNAVHVLAVKVFCKGGRNTARYVLLHADNPAGMVSNTKAEKATGSNYSGPMAIDNGYAGQAGRTIKGKGLLRPDVVVKKSPFGTPVVKFRDPSMGTLYKPNAYEMHRYYEKYQRAKKSQELRIGEALSRQARLKFEQGVQSYRSQRNMNIQQQMKHQDNK